MVKEITIKFRDTNTQKKTEGGWRFLLHPNHLEVIMQGMAIMKDDDLGIDMEEIYDEIYIIHKASIHNLQKGYANKAQEYFVDISFGSGKFVSPYFAENKEANKFLEQIKEWWLT